MRNSRSPFFRISTAATLAAALISPVLVAAQTASPNISVQWEHVLRVSNTTPTLQVVVNPPLRRGSAIHDRAFQALRDLSAGARQNVLGFFLARSTYRRFSGRHEGAFRGAEFQHHSAVDV